VLLKVALNGNNPCAHPLRVPPPERRSFRLVLFDREVLAL
jgi:hypothetical protein